MQAAERIDAVVKVVDGEFLCITRTQESATGEIYQQTLPSRRPAPPGGRPPVTAECWTCLHFQDHIFKKQAFVGQRVRVHGLQKAAVYNGQEGAIVEILSQERVGVKLPQPCGPAKEIAVRRANLTSTEPDVEAMIAELEAEIPRAPPGAAAQLRAEAAKLQGRAGAVTKTFLVCWPLALVANLKARTQFSKGPRVGASTPVADVVFSDQLQLRLWLSVLQETEERGRSGHHVGTLTATSLSKAQPLDNCRGPVINSTCALVSRPVDSEGGLTVLFRDPPTMPEAQRHHARVCNWVECGVGDSRAVALFSLPKQLDRAEASELSSFPRGDELMALSEELGIEGAAALGGAAGEIGEGDRFLAVVVKLTELVGRRVDTPEAFERAAFQEMLSCVHTQWLERVSQLGLSFLRAGDGPCRVVLGSALGEKGVGER